METMKIAAGSDGVPGIEFWSLLFAICHKRTRDRAYQQSTQLRIRNPPYEISISSNRNCLKAKYTHKNLLNQFVTDFSIMLDRRFKSNNK